MDDYIRAITEIYPTFVQFKRWAKGLPKHVRRQAKVSFSEYLEIGRPKIEPNRLYRITPEQATKLKYLQGPHGKALFTVWVVQRLSDQQFNDFLGDNHADQEAS